MPLTPKQQRFCEEYLIDLNATVAAQRAGYHKKMASKLVAKSSIQTEIQRQMAERSARTQITIDWVVEEMRKNYERCVEAEEYGNANKALELLGRHVGAFPNKHEHSTPGGTPIQIIEVVTSS